jgi:hypothetical protein
MNGRIFRFDVILALASVGAVSIWGDPVTRLGEVSGLLALWTSYFVATLLAERYWARKLQPVRVR